MEHAPVLYLADLVSSRTLRKIWISSEANGYLVPTEQFEFARKPPGVSPSGVCFRQLGWRGRICRPDGPQEWFGELGSSGVDHWRLGLQLTRGRAL